MSKPFLTQEIGSLAKPRWRTKGFRGEPLSHEEVTEAAHWGRELGIKDYQVLVELLKEGNSSNRKRAVREWSALYAIRLFEASGLDVFYDGEQLRSEMYEHVVSRTTGLKFLGFIKSFDYRYFNKAACIDKPKIHESFYLDEFFFTKRNTQHKIKVPFTGPYTIVDWTFNEYYENRLTKEMNDFKRRRFEAKRQFLFDVVEEVVRPEIGRLVESGAKWIQIDEPAATTNPTSEEMELFVESFNKTVKGFNCIFSLHNCYSNYEILAKHACRLRDCNQLALEFANRDSRMTGIGSTRTGYKALETFEEYGFKGNYGLGVIDVHTNFVESPQLVRDRILHAVDMVEDPNRIYPSPDCGLRTREWEVSFQKLKNLVSGAYLARKALM